MHLRISIILLLLTIGPSVSSQITRQANFDNYEELFDKTPDVNELHGSPYLNDSWEEVRVLINGKSRLYKQAKYNLHQGYMEVMVDGSHKYIKATHLTSFKFPNSKTDTASMYIDSRNMIINNKKFDGLLLLTQVNERKVITAHKVSIRKASKENPLLAGTENKGRILITKENYVLSKGELKRIKKSKDFLKLFPSDSKSIKRLIKSKKFNLKEHIDIVQLLRVVG